MRLVYRMGAHPNCPSRLQASGLSLQEFLERHPEVLGPEVYHHFDGQLPFLLKVGRVQHPSTKRKACRSACCAGEKGPSS